MFVVSAVVLGWSSTSAASDWALNIGVLEVVSLPGSEHLGVYPYVGAARVIPGELVDLIAGIGVEWAPENDRWGAVITLVVEKRLSAAVGVDLNLALIHDQAATDWSNAELYLGAGPGLSFFLDSVTLSPFVSVFRGINVDAWSLVPGLNIAYAL